MRDKRLAYYLFSLLTALVTAVAIYGIMHTVSGRQASGLYGHFRSCDDVRAVFYRDFRIDDSTTVDVTILTALDSSGLDCLVKEFGISRDLVELHAAACQKGHPIRSFYICRRDNPEIVATAEEKDIDYVSFSISDSTFYVFRIMDTVQLDKITRHEHYKIIKK